MLKKIILIVLIIASLFLVYLAGGYLLRASFQPALVGGNKTFFFFGFYILGIVYSLAAIICIVITIIAFVKFRKTR